MNFKTAVKFLLGLLLLLTCNSPSAFGQNFSFTNSVADGENFALWNTWNRHGEETNIKFPVMEGNSTSTNFYFNNQSYPTNSTTPIYLVADGLINPLSGYGFSPQFNMIVNSEKKIDYIAWQVYHMAISANYDPPYYTNVFNSVDGNTSTNIASINYDSVKLSSRGGDEEILPERIELFYNYADEIEYHGGTDSFLYHGTIFVWDLTGYNYYNVGIEMAMGHSSNYQMQLNYTTSEESVPIPPVALSFSVNNNLPLISFNSESGVTYEVYNSASLVSIDSSEWNLFSTIVGDGTTMSVSGNFNHDNQYWYVRSIE